MIRETHINGNLSNIYDLLKLHRLKSNNLKFVFVYYMILIVKNRNFLLDSYLNEFIFTCIEYKCLIY